MERLRRMYTLLISFPWFILFIKIATSETLKYYGAFLAETSAKNFSLDERHVLQVFKKKHCHHWNLMNLHRISLTEMTTLRLGFWRVLEARHWSTTIFLIWTVPWLQWKNLDTLSSPNGSMILGQKLKSLHSRFCMHSDKKQPLFPARSLLNTQSTHREASCTPTITWKELGEQCWLMVQ